ncbi:hypothetical protein HOG81_04820, partial [bacterium]|nr:hypothetical protein [bacterium]
MSRCSVSTILTFTSSGLSTRSLTAISINSNITYSFFYFFSDSSFFFGVFAGSSFAGSSFAGSSFAGSSFAGSSFAGSSFAGSSFAG